MEQIHQVIRDEDRNGEDMDELSNLPETPYWIMRGVVGTHIFVWLFMCFATGFEIILGTETLLSPPGEPPWIRNQKMRKYQADKGWLHYSDQPTPDWYRLWVAASAIQDEPAHDAHGGGHGDTHAPAAAGHGDTHDTSGHGAAPVPPPAHSVAAPAHGAGH